MQYNIPITPELLASHKIKPQEYEEILKILGRIPNLVELGVFSAMWSEHCSYKTTRIHLKNMHTTGAQVICGPGENAGVVDGGDGDAIIFKMESHNHPSFIEPFHGAATGVGGILRDVFTMGARPIANVNSLRFGDISNPSTKQLLAGVVSGISFYGNCVGVPMVAGECTFDSSYNGNNLVNAMSVGVAKKDKIFYSAAGTSGSSMFYLGSKTGRDGIHGASMSSGAFSNKKQEERSTVQVGDPFAEKLLIEACLELMQTDAVIAIQDMGAAGLTCSSIEMASKGGKGVEIDIDLVPQREIGMNAYEVLLSESQERMLVVLKDGSEDLAYNIFKKWGLDCARIGKITDTGNMVIKENGVVVGSIPVAPVSDASPVYNRPFEVKIDETITVLESDINDADFKSNVLKVLSHPDIASKRFIWEKYDSGVQNRAIFACGQNSGLVTFGDQYTKDGVVISKALAITSDCTPRYVASDAFSGAIAAVCESYRNISSTGAKPLALTNCLNFGNPENPIVMGQLVRAIEGISHAAKILNTPVVSGNVSLYNETDGISINPTPTIGMVGMLQDVNLAVTRFFTNEEDFIYLIGHHGKHLTNSIYANVAHHKCGGLMPQISLEDEVINSEFIRLAIEKKLVKSCSDVSNGGLITTIAKMIKHVGVYLRYDGNLTQFFFGEDLARYVIAVPKESNIEFVNLALEHSILYTHIGFTSGTDIIINGNINIARTEITSAQDSLQIHFER